MPEQIEQNKQDLVNSWEIWEQEAYEATKDDWNETQEELKTKEDATNLVNNNPGKFIENIKDIKNIPGINDENLLAGLIIEAWNKLSRDWDGSGILRFLNYADNYADVPGIEKLVPELEKMIGDDWYWKMAVLRHGEKLKSIPGINENNLLAKLITNSLEVNLNSRVIWWVEWTFIKEAKGFKDIPWLDLIWLLWKTVNENPSTFLRNFKDFKDIPGINPEENQLAPMLSTAIRRWDLEECLDNCWDYIDIKGKDMDWNKFNLIKELWNKINAQNNGAKIFFRDIYKLTNIPGIFNLVEELSKKEPESFFLNVNHICLIPDVNKDNKLLNLVLENSPKAPWGFINHIHALENIPGINENEDFKKAIISAINTPEWAISFLLEADMWLEEFLGDFTEEEKIQLIQTACKVNPSWLLENAVALNYSPYFKKLWKVKDATGNEIDFLTSEIIKAIDAAPGAFLKNAQNYTDIKWLNIVGKIEALSKPSPKTFLENADNYRNIPWINEKDLLAKLISDAAEIAPGTFWLQVSAKKFIWIPW